MGDTIRIEESTVLLPLTRPQQMALQTFLVDYMRMRSKYRSTYSRIRKPRLPSFYGWRWRRKRE
jgi:hypothetical protein